MGAPVSLRTKSRAFTWSAWPCVTRIAATGARVAPRIFSGSAPASTMMSPSGAWITYAFTSKPSMETVICSISLSANPLAFQRRAVTGDPVDVVDIGDAPDLAYHFLDVLHARRLEREFAEGRSILDGVNPRRKYVHTGIRDGGR